MNEKTQQAVRSRPMKSDDWPAVIALNNDAVPHMNLLDVPRLKRMVDCGCRGSVIESEGEILAVALWFDETGRDYDSPNYRWFRDRYGKFTYVDRIVVADPMRGHGLGHRIYQTVFAAAAEDHSPVVTCEVYEKPPNPGSRAFHEHLGFTIIGRQVTENGNREVALMARPLGSVTG